MLCTHSAVYILMQVAKAAMTAKEAELMKVKADARALQARLGALQPAVSRVMRR